MDILYSRPHPACFTSLALFAFIFFGGIALLVIFLESFLERERLDKDDRFGRLLLSGGNHIGM